MVDRIVAVIPARYGSTRFPGKPLIPLLGKPMIEWVYCRAQRCALLDRVVVATDDQRIFRTVQEFGGEVVMTSPMHPTGTDRLAEVAAGLQAEVVINVQGDEPLVRGNMLAALIQPILEEDIPMATLATDLQMSDLDDPHQVKVVTDMQGNALYFSRAPIPYPWETEGARHKLHLGFYGFRRDFLLKIPLLPRTPLEKRENLEQLRILEHGFPIRIVHTPGRTIGVDRPSDLEVVASVLKEEEGLV